MKTSISVNSNNGKPDAILLASGFSKRYGPEDKLLLPFRGVPLARHTLELVCGGSLRPLLGQVFLVYASPAVGRLADGLPVTCIHNENPQLGRQESVRIGVLASKADYYLFFPCDQPLLDADTVRRVVEGRAEGHITVPCFEGRQGSPTLFSGTFRGELLALPAGQAPNAVKRAHPQQVIEVAATGEAALLDIDTPEDLERILLK